ncbi:signal peptidase I [Mycoplasmopsis pulmonis]|nr:signal peptidase I [Mycoplasmopsis pulmonis]MDZ7293567.1 signal peptidase I [Mycoplasmopsis pulmonis]VEU68393.1 Signal peptidase I (SPase I) (leader peptidase I) [Mycoplasmopsis pulmonis]
MLITTIFTTLFFITFLITFFQFFSIIKISGNSMFPTFKDGSLKLFKKTNQNLNLFQIVVFNKNDNLYVKRIIALPGDNLIFENGKVFRNDQDITNLFDPNELTLEKKLVVPNNAYFVIGDNTTQSTDSRHFGFVFDQEIIAKY